MGDAIVIERLSKSFGHVQALDSITVRVRPGELYGFIGRNGAGKTTTIRALLGMIRPDAGTIQVLGQPVGSHGRGPWRRVGHLVEQPAAYPELTVRQNLEIACRLHGLTNTHAVSRIIERLGLDPYASRKAHALSTGNLQRLGLARALVHAPELLILDEPTNGLDPAGVVEIRELLASLAHERGMTVFLSSHILTEVDRLATRIGIIHQGCVLEELEVDQLAALRARRLEIEARHFDDARRALITAGFAVRVDEQTLVVQDARAIEAPDAVATILVQAGTPPTRLAVEQEDLEAYFLRLTGGAI
ncbi:MAG: ABC transporter ATP-binding protein [Chloroflexales bacterium]|nr:ABC transporter ATP-binding protein [Chloroflexales bacterium]